MGGEFSEFYEDRSERAESEESLEKSEFDGDKRLSLNSEPRVVNETDHDRAVRPGAVHAFFVSKKFTWYHVLLC